MTKSASSSTTAAKSGRHGGQAQQRNGGEEHQPRPSSAASAEEETPLTPDPNMKVEIEAAVGFLTDFLVKTPKNLFSSESVDLFRRSLQSVLYRHYQGHWHAQEPLRGSGFRCLRINGKLDPLVIDAADACKLPLRKLRQAFPAELTVWIDPGDVSVRFGEEGSVGVFFANRRNTDDEEKRRTAEELAVLQQTFQRCPPTLSTTPPRHLTAQQPHHQGYPQRRQFHQPALVQFPQQQQQQQQPLQQQQQQQKTPLNVSWNPQWSPASASKRSSPLLVGGPKMLNGLSYQQQHHRYATPSPIESFSPPESSGEEQRCKMLAEQLMRENLMACLAPGLVASRPEPVGVGVN